jgi:anti-sigma28 factor (negative regulator of flagellin synthesis)
MYTKTLKHLSIIKDELENLLESHSEKVLDTKSFELQDDIERNVINSINEVIEQIEMISEDIENGTYEIDVEDDDEY